MKVFMDQDFVITKFRLAIYVPNGKGAPVHTDRPCHGMVYQNGGQMCYRFDTGKVLRVKKGDILYLPKGSNYCVETEETEGGCYAINFETAQVLNADPFVFHPSGAQGYPEYFREAEKTWSVSRPGDSMACMSLLYRIIAAMKRSYARGYIPQDKLQLLQPALEFIDENFTKTGISIPELAGMCKISESYFRRLFRSLLAVTPKHYIVSKKIKRACELLRSQEYSVAVVAELCGYSDEYYFSREFSKAMGCAPSVYAKNGR